MYEGFEAVIGLEVHAQLLTDSKLFCGCRSDYGQPPNSLTCPVCLGLPGALPVLNRKAVEHAVRMILAVSGEVCLQSGFSRKNYFYPDLPKGYQITQYERPLGMGGEINYRLDSGREKTCRLERIHIEEDAGKLLHPEQGKPSTRIDHNRCGVPLAEIVSEADIRTPGEARSYLQQLRQLLQYLEICSGDMEKGHFRCDANISVREEGDDKLGTRTELKNMNSFKWVERSLQFEIDRQVNLIKSGKEVEQATLLWNEKRQVSEAMRSKEESEDYRYFPEPDLPDLLLSEEWVEQIRRSLPELPGARRKRFVREYNIREYDASILTEKCELADYYEQVMSGYDDGQTAANWIITELLGSMKEAEWGIGNCPVQPDHLAELLSNIESGMISGKMAKEVFGKMIETGKTPAVVIDETGLIMMSDEAAIAAVVNRVLVEEGGNVEKYRAGEIKLLGFFMGRVMRATQGRADPGIVNRLLKERLEE